MSGSDDTHAEVPEEGMSLAHAGPDGHVCGDELALRTFAVAVLESQEGATDVYVMPRHTLVVDPDKATRFDNSPEMIEAIDNGLLSGEVALGSFRLLAPGGAKP